MVYINSRGEMVEHRPFLTNLMEMVTGFAQGVVMFFRSLFSFIPSVQASNTSGQRGSGSRENRRQGISGARIAGLAKSGGPGAPPCAPGGG